MNTMTAADRPAGANAGVLSPFRAPTSLAAPAGARPLVARRDSYADRRDAMTRVIRTRSGGLVAEFGAPA